ncbi:hypothetical protein ACFX2I_037841 [Malus domestica]
MEEGEEGAAAPFWAYALNKAWMIGFLMDIFGALLMLRALSLAPVSVIQPVSGCGLAILLIFSHFYLKEMMNDVDWMGITLAGIGTIGVGAGGEEQKASIISVFHLPWLAIVVAFLFVLLNGWLRIYRRQHKEQELMEYEVVEEIIYGLESGILFGYDSVQHVSYHDSHIDSSLSSFSSKREIIKKHIMSYSVHASRCQ